MSKTLPEWQTNLAWELTNKPVPMNEHSRRQQFLDIIAKHAPTTPTDSRLLRAALEGQELVEYLRGLKVNERVIETDKSSCLRGRGGTVYLNSEGATCVMWDKKSGEVGQMGTSVTGGTRRVNDALTAESPAISSVGPQSATEGDAIELARKALEKTKHALESFWATKQSQNYYKPAYMTDALRATIVALAAISTPAKSQAVSDTERLDWLVSSDARIVHSRDGDTCWLNWPHGKDESDSPVNQEGAYHDPREAIDAAIELTRAGRGTK